MGRFFYWLANLLWYKIGPWKVVSQVPKDIKKAVIAAAPHTANEDFPVGIGAWYTENKSASFIAKKELFDGPMGFIFNATGGIPIDRATTKNMVEQAADFFKDRDELFLVIAPEGTRAWRPRWKTGFYYIAKAAGVPIILAYMDFGKKEVGLGEVFYPTDNLEADFDYIEKFYSGITAADPSKYNPKMTEPKD
ncbi:MAG: 1-acyl-sn-glycerol-3-phosphate acyltransferase [Flavobacteriales bacterium]|nr:1-acyl-sn-glycerol-3-phosphate acyltransferase [Flavobacteriales bacterium]